MSDPDPVEARPDPVEIRLPGLETTDGRTGTLVLRLAGQGRRDPSPVHAVFDFDEFEPEPEPIP